MERFEVVKLIGEGGYGVVYKCKSKETGDIVAIKKIKHSINGDPRKVGLREIRLLTALKHPNINQLLGAFKSKDRLFLVLECVEKTLLDVLNECPTGIQHHRFRSYTYQLCCALQYCHSKGVVHRDVKPENLLVTERDHLKLCDFGFARYLPSSNHNTSIPAEDGEFEANLPTGFHQLTVYVATRWYRPPELILRLPYGKPVDVWTIGCILVEMATGEPLFCGDTDIDQLFQIQTAVGSFTSDQMDAMLASPKYQFIASQNQKSVPSAKKDTLAKYQLILGDEMYEILKSCVQNDPQARATADQCVNHPGFELERRTVTPQMSSYAKLSQLLNPKPSTGHRNRSKWDWTKMISEMPEKTTASDASNTPRVSGLISKEEEMLMDAEVDLEKERQEHEAEIARTYQLVKSQREFGLKSLSSLKSSPAKKPGGSVSPPDRISTISSTSSLSSFPVIHAAAQRTSNPVSGSNSTMSITVPTLLSSSPPLQNTLHRSMTWFQSPIYANEVMSNYDKSAHVLAKLLVQQHTNVGAVASKNTIADDGSRSRMNGVQTPNGLPQNAQVLVRSGTSQQQQQLNLYVTKTSESPTQVTKWEHPQPFQHTGLASTSTAASERQANNAIASQKLSSSNSSPTMPHKAPKTSHASNRRKDTTEVYTNAYTTTTLKSLKNVSSSSNNNAKSAFLRNSSKFDYMLPEPPKNA